MLEIGKVSTNVYLRRMHNFAVDMTWLPWPVLPKKRMAGSRIQGEARHHLRGTSGHRCPRANPERKAFYQLAWHLGASQSDLAYLEAENVDWENHIISYARKKTGIDCHYAL